MTYEERLAAARAFRRNVTEERTRLKAELASVRTDISAVANSLSGITAVWALLPHVLREKLGSYIT